jgi:hypothetical protein
VNSATIMEATSPANAVLSKERALSLIQALISDGILTGRDLAPFVPEADDPYDPEFVTQEFEAWFKGLGIELVTGRPFRLDACTFTREELEEAESKGSIVLVSPKGLSGREVGRLTHFESWAFDDPLVSETVEEEDLWFLTPLTTTPDAGNVSGRAIRRQYEEHGYLGFSLQRYMIFAARARFLTGKLPDQRWWVWLLRGRYDRSGSLIAGFDPRGRFSVHAWLPHFQSSFVGCRTIRIADRIPATERAHVA